MGASPQKINVYILGMKVKSRYEIEDMMCIEAVHIHAKTVAFQGVLHVSLLLLIPLL